MATQTAQEALVRLRRELPPLDAESTVGEQARTVLHFLLDAAAKSEPGSRLDAEPIQCPNCGRHVENIRSPYCSVQCREEAAFVRQFRAGLMSDALFDPERQTAFGQTLWHLLGGGRPLRRALIPEKDLAKIIAKAGGKCEGCGAVATTVDHIGTACNRPINLRPACENCCRTREFGAASVTSTLEFHHKLKVLAARIASEKPLHACDDADNWDWRAHVASRR